MAPTAPPATRREVLHEILVGILGSRNVYFQAPENLIMKYPAIVYERDYANVLYADNQSYRVTKRYQVTLIHEDPDTDTWDKIEALPLCSFVRHFETDELHHDIFNLYF